jgi:hypothetical protein
MHTDTNAHAQTQTQTQSRTRTQTRTQAHAHAQTYIKIASHRSIECAAEERWEHTCDHLGNRNNITSLKLEFILLLWLEIIQRL